MCESSFCPCYMVFKWLGVVVVLPLDLPTLFSILFSGDRPTRNRKGLIVIRHAVLWAIWETRNRIIFFGKIFDLSETFFPIKHFSWKWFLAKAKFGHSLFYEWCVDLLECISWC